MGFKALFTAPDKPIANGEPKILPDDSPSSLARRNFLSYPAAMGLALGLICADGVAAVALPVVVAKLIDGPVAHGDWGSFLRWILVLTAVYVVIIVGSLLGGRLGFLTANYADHFLRMQTTDRLLEPRGLGGERRTPGALLSIASSDTREVALSKRIVLYPVGELITVVLSIGILFSYSWQLGLLTIIGAPIVAGGAARAARPLEARAENEQEAGSRAAGAAADLVEGVRIIKGIGAEQEAIRRYAVRSETALSATLANNRAIGWFDAVVSSVSGIHAGLVAFVAAFLAYNGTITIGQLVASVGLAVLVVSNVGFVSALLGQIWARSKASARRVLSVVLAPPRFPRVEESPRLSRNGVEPLRLVIEGHTIDVGSGEFVVVRSPSNVVNSVTEQLAVLEIAPEGRFFLGGHDVVELDLEEIHSQVTVSPHEATLFEGTIWENVGLGLATTNEFAAAIEAANATDVLEQLPGGAQAQVGEAGLQVSGGQRQRIALARSLIVRAPILVLNDPTSAVDSVTEEKVAEGVKHIREGLSTLVFTDSPAWFAVADKSVDITSVDNCQQANASDQGAEFNQNAGSDQGA